MLVTFGKLGDITDDISQGDISDTFIPEEDCIHQKMFYNGLSTSNGGFLAAILSFLLCIVFEERVVRRGRVHDVPRCQGLPLIRFPCCDTFHDCCNFPNGLKFFRIHIALLVPLSEPGHAIVDTFRSIHPNSLLLIVPSDGNYAVVPILLVGFLGVILLEHAIIRLLRHIRYGYDILLLFSA